MNGASNLKGSGAGIVVERPNELLIELSLKFELKANKSQAEYETLIASMVLTLEMGTSSLKGKSDSQLLVNQVIEKYQMKDPN